MATPRASTPPARPGPIAPSQPPIPDPTDEEEREDEDEDEDSSEFWSKSNIRNSLIVGGLCLALTVGFVFLLTSKKQKSVEQANNNQPPPTVQTEPTPPPLAAKPAPEPVAPKPMEKPDVKVDVPEKPRGLINEPPAQQSVRPDFGKLDQFGNPADQNTGLAQNDEFRGHQLLFWSPDTTEAVYFEDQNPMWKALEDKGFAIRRKVGKFEPNWLKDIDQLWILSTTSLNLTSTDNDAIVEFVKSGKGLCLLADNAPYLAEANELGKRLFDVRVSGNYIGQKIAYVKNGQLTPDLIKKHQGDYEVPEHPLLTGVNFVYEGITISNISTSNKLDVVLRASDGKSVVVASNDPDLRVIIDCGFTRYYFAPGDDSATFITKTAGTPRLAQNIAAFLAGKVVLKPSADDVPKDPGTKVAALEKRTLDEIKDELAKINAPSADENERAMRRLQSYRYLAGVPYRDLRLLDEFNIDAKAAAKICQKLGKLDHNPMNPGLPEDEFKTALRGASRSNLGKGHADLPDAIDGFMDDSDDRNIAMIGHRRWCLNPPLQKVGFGRVEEYTAMYAFDESRRFADYDYISWPAQGLMPVNYFGGRHAWNVSLNPERYKKVKDTVAVTVYRTNADGMKTGDALALDHKSVDTDEYGIDNCIIFRPREVNVAKGQRYRVAIDNLETVAGMKTSIEFTVEFCEAAAK